MQVEADGTPTVLGVMQQFLHNQGDAWSFMQNILQRVQRDLSLATADTGHAAAVSGAVNELVAFARTLGARLGEMHVALAQPGGGPAFASGPMDEAGCAQLAARVDARVAEAVHALERELQASR